MPTKTIPPIFKGLLSPQPNKTNQDAGIAKINPAGDIRNSSDKLAIRKSKTPPRLFINEATKLFAVSKKKTEIATYRKSTKKNQLRKVEEG
jgi:hypothetical protein